MENNLTVKDNEKEIAMLKELVSKVTLFLFGNGSAVGLDEDFRELSRRTGSIESTVKEVKAMLQDMVGYAGVTYDIKNHPGRREGDTPIDLKNSNWWVKTWEETIAPNLLDKFITASIVIIILNFQDLINVFAK